MNTIERIGELGVVPVVKIEEARLAPNLAEALSAGGLPCAEITFRTSAAAEAIRLMRQSRPEMMIGAGTVLTLAQAEAAVQAGAVFIVSPGFDEEIVDWCLERSVPVIPGVATPSEALLGLRRGLQVLKFFPCEALGGIPMLEAISAALVGLKFVPTGGIGIAEVAKYLKLPMVHAVGGSWMATSKLIAAEAFGDIERLAREAVDEVRAARSNGGQK